MPGRFGNTFGAAVGVMFVGSFAMMHFADASPAFQAADIASHRTLESASEGACGGGNCGAAMMDKNKDGKVSRDEALRYGFTDAQISNADRNGDGVLDPAEVAAMKNAGKGVQGSGAAKS
jgi:uncharacterized low-complexity protein